MGAHGIDQQALAEMSRAYAPRDIRGVGVWDDGDRLLKAYAIAAPADWPDHALLERARVLAVAQSALDAELGGTGLGAALVHRGADGDYVVVMNWTTGFMTRLTTFTGPRADPGALRQTSLGVGPCLWELAVIGHERESFHRHIVIGRDVDAWRSDLLAGSA
ncbi:hypothetical protein CLV63_104268 [Murinocardiopsis flavida]|uniref:Uncharacterized protein n=1 Tax=Murinocardiopsis flavida TaxID=645275 RepID=A0A2P8DP94_9ACTN|nr:hypothetical protein [Murinocardiopsis flavida]PSK99044.1 hypothetical protein CLV63_104268 [Murinocardiopsis flavida]